MRINPLALLLAVCVTPVSAASIGSDYASIQYARSSIDGVGAGDSLHSVAAVGRLGHQLTRRLAIEGRFGAGFAHDDITRKEGTVHEKVDYLAGVYGVGHLPMTGSLSAYVLAGFSHGHGTTEYLDGASPRSDSANGSGLSYGIGAALRLSTSTDLTLEYVSYLDTAELEIETFSAGVKFKF